MQSNSKLILKHFYHLFIKALTRDKLNEHDKPSKQQKGNLRGKDLAEGTGPVCSSSTYAFDQLQIPDDVFSPVSEMPFHLPFAPEKNRINNISTDAVTQTKDSNSYNEPEPHENMDTFFLPHGAVIDLSFDTSPNGCPTFFEHVMLPNPNGVNNGQGINQPPPNTFDLLPDIEFEVSDSGLFGESFIPDLETIVQKDILFPTDQYAEDLGQNHDTTRRRVDAFQQSFW
jgi:hypothetical protein